MATSCVVRPPSLGRAVSVLLPKGNVRRRGRDRWQARLYIGGRSGGSVSLGVFDTREAAGQVTRKVLKALLATAIAASDEWERGDSGDGDGRSSRGCSGRGMCGSIGPLDVWRVTQKLASDGWDVCGQLAGLLPRYVKVDPHHTGKYGYDLGGGKGCAVRGGYATAEEAYRAAVAAKKKEAERAG